VTRIADDELAQAMAANVDADGDDIGLDAWIQTWTPAEREQADENVRRSLTAARRQILGDGEDL
jgi:hypothetical protein